MSASEHGTLRPSKAMCTMYIHSLWLKNKGEGEREEGERKIVTCGGENIAILLNTVK